MESCASADETCKSVCWHVQYMYPRLPRASEFFLFCFFFWNEIMRFCRKKTCESVCLGWWEGLFRALGPSKTNVWFEGLAWPHQNKISSDMEPNMATLKCPCQRHFFETMHPAENGRTNKHVHWLPKQNPPGLPFAGLAIMLRNGERKNRTTTEETSTDLQHSLEATALLYLWVRQWGRNTQQHVASQANVSKSLPIAINKASGPNGIEAEASAEAANTNTAVSSLSHCDPNRSHSELPQNSTTPSTIWNQPSALWIWPEDKFCVTLNIAGETGFHWKEANVWWKSQLGGKSLDVCTAERTWEDFSKVMLLSPVFIP